MKLAVTAWNFDPSGAGPGLPEQGELAEQLGFDALWLPENHFTGPQALPSPLLLLAGVAARTERLRLGSTSYLLPIRHPLLAAEEVAALDQLSGGRVILGVGRGYQDLLYKTFNVPIKEKRRRFASNLKQMISAWEGKPIAEVDGTAVQLAPLPAQRPHPPLWVAAFGPLAIKQAASLGLPYLASPIESLASLVEKYALHRQQLAAAGQAPQPVVPVMRTLYITDSPAKQRQARDSLAREAAARAIASSSPVEDWALVGSLGYVREQLARYQEAIDLNYLIVRGRIQGISDAEQLASHEALVKALA